MSHASVNGRRATFGEFTTTPSSSSSITQVEFVHAKGSSGQKRPYQFGGSQKRRLSLPTHSSRSPAQGNIGESQQQGGPSSQSLDEILQLSRKKPKKGQPRRNDGFSDENHQNKHDSGNYDSAKQPATTNSITRQDSDLMKRDELQHANPQNGDDSQRKQQQQQQQQHHSKAKAHPPSSPQHLSGLRVEDVIQDREGCRPRSNSTDGELNLPQRGLCDERLVLQSYRWDDSVTHQKLPKGLSNLGNTCFLNSTLQCLAYLPPFVQSLLSIDSQTLRSNKHSNGKVFKGKKVTLMMQDLFRKIHNQQHRQHHHHGQQHASSLEPQQLVKALPMLNAYNLGGYRFRPGRQEDAHEFLVHLLDAMNDGELQHAGINQQVSGWRDQLPVSRLDQTTFVHRCFGGYFRSQVKCTNCDYKSNTYDPFFDLSLEVSRGGCTSVDEAIGQFSRKETLDSDNLWQCSECRERVPATKQLTVFRPPLSLLVQFKRFAYSEFSLGGGGGGFGHGRFGSYGNAGRKISRRIQYPANLRLPLSDGRFCEYQLTGVVMHLGQSATSGHYTAYIRKPTPGGEHRWFRMDDSFVERVKENTVLQEKDAYLLFYSRKKVALDFPAPPPQVQRTLKIPQQQQESNSNAKTAKKRKTTEHITVTQHKKQESKARAIPADPNPGPSEQDTPLTRVQDKKSPPSVPTDSDQQKKIATISAQEDKPLSKKENKIGLKPNESDLQSSKSALDETKPPFVPLWSKAVKDNIEKGSGIHSTPTATQKPKNHVAGNSGRGPEMMTTPAAKPLCGKEDKLFNSGGISSISSRSRSGTDRSGSDSSDSTISRSSSSNDSSDSSSSSDWSDSSTGSSSDSSNSNNRSSEYQSESVQQAPKSAKSIKRQVSQNCGGLLGSLADTPEVEGDIQRKKREEMLSSQNNASKHPTHAKSDEAVKASNEAAPGKRGTKRNAANRMTAPRLKKTVPFGSKQKHQKYQSSSSRARLSLLGNTSTSQWDQNESSQLQSTQPSNVSNDRRSLEQQIQRRNSAEKHALRLGTWDRTLDEGRPKKVKKKESSPSHTLQNNFQRAEDQKRKDRISKGVQSMHKQKHNKQRSPRQKLKRFKPQGRR